MAERRMFAKSIIDSDDFLDLPLSVQALYFHLSMRADDDGFVDKPKAILRTIGGSYDDINLLLAKCFLIPFASGVVVIRHWKIHNHIRKDRYNETNHKDDKARLRTDSSGKYELLPQSNEEIHDNQPTTNCQPHDNQPTTNCQPHDNQPTTNCQPLVDTGKVSIELGKNIPPYSPPPGAGGDKDLQAKRFTEFWQAYPKKIGKGAAEKAWRKVRPNKELFEQIMKALERAKNTVQWTKENGQFIPNPATWLNQSRWEDEGIELQLHATTDDGTLTKYTEGWDA